MKSKAYYGALIDQVIVDITHGANESTTKMFNDFVLSENKEPKLVYYDVNNEFNVPDCDEYINDEQKPYFSTLQIGNLIFFAVTNFQPHESDLSKYTNEDTLVIRKIYLDYLKSFRALFVGN